MDPLTLFLIISGVVGLAGSAGQYYANKSLQDDAQDFNASEADKARIFNAQEAINARAFTASENALSRQFQLDFDGTKYQRLVNDLKAAGINPQTMFGVNGPGLSTAGSAAVPVANGSAASVNPTYSGMNSVALPNFVSNAIQAATSIEVAKNKKLRNEIFTNAKQANIHDIKNYYADLKETGNPSTGPKDPKYSSNKHGLTPHEEEILRKFYAKLK